MMLALQGQQREAQTTQSGVRRDGRRPSSSTLPPYGVQAPTSHASLLRLSLTFDQNKLIWNSDQGTSS